MGTIGITTTANHTGKVIMTCTIPWAWALNKYLIPPIFQAGIAVVITRWGAQRDLHNRKQCHDKMVLCGNKNAST